MIEPIAPDYEQEFLLPPALEEWVPRDHPARFLREFVDALDLAALGFAQPACLDGRPPYAPGLLLKVWLDGYVQRIRSTRKLEAACREHLSLLWLTGMIQPDHNSLWRFWRTNQAALRAVFQQTVQVAVRSGCVGLARQALDGTKLAAAASSHSGWSKEHMDKLLAASGLRSRAPSWQSSAKTPRQTPRPATACPPASPSVKPCASKSKTASRHSPPTAATTTTPPNPKRVG